MAATLYIKEVDKIFYNHKKKKSLVTNDFLEIAFGEKILGYQVIMGKCAI